MQEDESHDLIPALSYELTYERVDTSGHIPEGPITGELSVQTSSNFDDLLQQEDDVLVYLKIYECGFLDKKIVKMMDENKLSEAVELKKEVVEILNSIVSKDKVWI